MILAEPADCKSRLPTGVRVLERSAAWMLLALAAGFAATEARPAWGQAVAEAATVEELRRTVEELQQAIAVRDAIIADLLQRIGQLEQRVGVAARDPAPPPEAPGLPPEAPAAPPPIPAPAPRDEPQQTAEAPTSPPAPGQIEVDEELVATALERALVQEGALVLPPGTVQVQPSLTYTRRETAAPGTVLVVEGQPVAAEQEVRRDRLLAGLAFRVGLPFDTQLGLTVPFGYERASTATRVRFAGVQESTDEVVGFGDVGVTLSKGLLRERGWRPDLVASLRWGSTTGRTDDGVRIGSGFHDLTGSLTAAWSEDPLVFIGGLSYEHSFQRGGVQPGDTIGLSLGTLLAASPTTSLRFVLDQSFAGKTEFNGQEVPGSDRIAGLFRVGASSLLWAGTLIDVDFGIGLTDAAPDYTLNVSFPIRFNLPARF